MREKFTQQKQSHARTRKILFPSFNVTIPLFLQLIPEHGAGISIHPIFLLLSRDFSLAAKCLTRDHPN